MSTGNDDVTPRRQDLNEVMQLRRVESGINIFESATKVKNTLKRNKEDDEKSELDESQQNASPIKKTEEEKEFVSRNGRLYLHVAAIDLGTTFSGYAFSSFSDFMKDPLKIYSPTWNSGVLISQKTPTFILYDPDDKFHSFGYDAENKYIELLEHSEKEAVEWKAFYNFKMKLYERNIEPEGEELSLIDDQGRGKPALVVFADSIRFLKDQFFEVLEKQGFKASTDDVRFIITVPAIWDDRARGFMINAANKAGIPEEHLLMCLEPEAAAVLCKEHHVDAYHKTKCEDILNFDFGSEFVVADLGGGTVDITTNKVLRCGSLKELKKARGDDCGGIMVDKEFFDFLKTCIGSDFDDLKRENLSEFHDLRQTWEVKKRNTKGETVKAVSIPIAPPFSEKINQSKMKEHNKSIEIRRGKLQMPIEFFLSIFKKPVQKILKCLEEAVTDEIKSILLVGGFASCDIVYEAVKERFPRKHVYCPLDAELSVLKGAVIYGHNPDLIASRICRVWHGVFFNEHFSPVNQVCGENDFYVLTQKGEPITIDSRVVHRFSVDEKYDKETLRLTIFSSASDCMPTSNSRDLNCAARLDLDIPPSRKEGKRIIELGVKLKGTQFEFKARVKCRSRCAVAIV